MEWSTLWKLRTDIGSENWENEQEKQADLSSTMGKLMIIEEWSIFGKGFGTLRQ
jgi:hypothetical protein